MESILALTGLALTSAFSFGVALLLGWMTLAGLLHLLPASTPGLRIVPPVRTSAHVAALPARNRRARVIVTETKNRSRKMYTVRTA